LGQGSLPAVQNHPVSGSNAEQVYDTDGNILQAIDDALLARLLLPLLTRLASAGTPLTITELGAGTGRNTVKLLEHSSTTSIAHINALDLSPAMLSRAQERCETYLSANPRLTSPKLSFYEFNALDPEDFPEVRSVNGRADVILSTLVLEHLPLSTFFSSARSFLKSASLSAGYLVLTNMHAEMGRLGQAGFVDELTGRKIRGTSYVYEVDEVLAEGRRYGFVLEGDVVERAVAENDVGEGRLLGERGRKWIDVKVWFGMVMRLEG
jgi:SAM-dependent methyltransferase